MIWQGGHTIMSVYAATDFHGVYDIWEQIKNFLQEDDELYYLGDVTDRGPDGWRMLKEMLIDPRIHYILGNHDQMIIDSTFGATPSIRNQALRLHHDNGGNLTHKAMVRDDEYQHWVYELQKCPYYHIYTNKNNLKIFLSHSGSVKINDPYELIWNRDHWFYPEDDKEYDLIVHGHTPIPYLVEDLELLGPVAKVEPGAYWYDKKVDLDNCTCLTNCAVLFNLDTFDEEIFEGDTNERNA